MLSCICWACFMRPASWFFIIGRLPSVGCTCLLSASGVDACRCCTWPSNAPRGRARTARRETPPRAWPSPPRARAFRCAASDDSVGAPTSNASSTLRPVACSSATLSLSAYDLVGEMLVRGGQRERQRVAGERFELGLRRELRRHAGAASTAATKPGHAAGSAGSGTTSRGGGDAATAPALAAARPAAIAGRDVAMAAWRRRCRAHRPAPRRRARTRGRSAAGARRLSGANASMRSSVIAKPVASSGASARSARPCVADLVGELHRFRREAAPHSRSTRSASSKALAAAGTTCATAMRWNSDASSSSAGADDEAARGERVALARAAPGRRCAASASTIR